MNWLKDDQFVTKALRLRVLTLYSVFTPKVIHSFCGQKWPQKITILILAILLTACSASAPRSPGDICLIFKEKRSWYKAAYRMEKQWGVPLQIPMAIMHQESKFVADARPPRRYLLGIIPWGRTSSAYGYAQAKTGTWSDYRRATGNGGADRDDFSDAIDFIGWYVSESHRRNGVSKWDANAQYLNYHEGWGGYKRGSYRKKQWLLGVAGKVQRRAERYGAQYRQCKETLKLSWFERLF